MTIKGKTRGGWDPMYGSGGSDGDNLYKGYSGIGPKDRPNKTAPASRIPMELVPTNVPVPKWHRLSVPPN